MKPKAVFELSWEVCNKVGGIHTVITSKVRAMQDNYEEYFLVGPYYPHNTHGVFQEIPCPDNAQSAIEALRVEGIDVHYGIWLVPGEPKTLLIDYTRFTSQTNTIKKYLWDNHKIDTLNTQFHDVDEPMVWSWAAGRAIELLASALTTGQYLVHCHEWLSAGAIYYLKDKAPTVFTTHATALGRAIASADKNLYQDLEKFNPEEEAKKHGAGLWAKFQIEKTAASTANCFTTVSGITAFEAKTLLGKEPDVILPNGLDIGAFPRFQELLAEQRKFRERINEFLLYYFFPYQHFDLTKTLIYFIAGRYEFRDKGIDAHIQALGKLNNKLKEEKSDKTIVALLLIPAATRGINTQLLRARTDFFDLHDTLEDSKGRILNRILNSLMTNEKLSAETLLPPQVAHDLKRKSHKMNARGLPPLTTHDLQNPESDPIMRELHSVGLKNDEDDKVKVVFYPQYLTGADQLLDLTYSETILGTDLGVFPSYYEPWGYTPLESSALGVPAVTTDVAGFGAYVKDKVSEKNPGVYVLSRRDCGFEDTVSKLTELFIEYANKRDLTEDRLHARKIAELADWKNFVEFYKQSHEKAVTSFK
jgi:glycogen synthase